MFENIMVPSDGSEHVDKALDVAIEMAKKFNSKITAIHVMDETMATSYDKLEDEGNEILRKISEKGKKEGVMVIEHLISGDPLRDMKIIAKKSEVDSVVISPRGRNELDEIIVGSVTDRIIDTFDIPIILIK